MTERPFHHGNLRRVLLDRAESVLRDRGLDALSLRELAREAGVSHGAPRSHFVDRAALLDALAVRGFERLAESVEAAAAAHEDPTESLRALGRVQLDFSVREGALADLMFAAKGASDGASPAVAVAAERMFIASSGIIARSMEALRGAPVDVLRTTLLMASTTQGIASLVTSGRVSEAMGEQLLDDALALYIDGSLPPPEASEASEAHGA
jgi:AcrR family transcriptional regulator